MRLEPITAIQEHHVIQRRRAQPDRSLRRGAQHLFHVRVGVRAERRDPLRHAWPCGHEAIERLERRERADAWILLCEYDVRPAAAGEESGVQEQRLRIANRVIDITTPTRDDDVEPAVAVEIACSQPIPAAV